MDAPPASTYPFINAMVPSAPMSRAVAVVIPALNEEGTVVRAIESAFVAGASTVIVSDGGSTDATEERSQRAGAFVLSCDDIRGRQMNCAARETEAEILIFLHADSVLPVNAVANVRKTIEGGAIFGGFQIEFIESDPRLRLAAAMINLRTRLTRCPWGDQAQFIERKRFLEVGGFREDPIMEDYEMALRMKKLGRTVILPSRVRTSGRRFLQKGLWRTALINWRIILSYRLGTDPAALAELYRES